MKISFFYIAILFYAVQALASPKIQKSASTLLKTDLLTVFKQALENDPVYRKEYYNYLAIQQYQPQARANLLPLVQAKGDISYTKSYLSANNPFASFAPTGKGYGYSIELTQPIFNITRWKELAKASDIVKKAEASYNAAYQQLIIRTTQAYFNVLEAQDNVEFTRTEKLAYKRQLEQAQQRYKVGLSAITAVYEAQAAFDAVIAREIAAYNALDNQKEELSSITGQWYQAIKSVKQGIVLMNPQPNVAEEWEKTALKQNYELLAAKLDTKIAQHNLHIQRSRHLPNVSAIGNYTKTHTEKLGDTNSNASIRLALQLPIIQGGIVIAKTRQSAHDYQASLAALEAIQRKISSHTRQFFNSVNAGISQVKADRQAVKSSKSSADSTQAAFEVGTRTVVDVLNAKKEMFRTQRALSSDLYTYLKATLNLKQMTGTLSENDLIVINQMLA